MDSEGRIIGVVLGMEFSDYNRRTGDDKTGPKNWWRQLARKVGPGANSVRYSSLAYDSTASERTTNALKYTWCRDFALNKPVSKYHYVLQTTVMGSRFVSISEPVYISWNMSISLITLLGIALISKLIKLKVAYPTRAACGCPGAHGDTPGQVCRSPGTDYCVEIVISIL